MAAINEKSNMFGDVYGGILLGSTEFIKAKLDELKDQVEGEDIVYKRDLSGYVEKEAILEVIKKEYGKDLEDLRVRTRKGNTKKIAIYLMRELTGLTNSEIGEVFDMKYSAVSKAALSVERGMGKDKGLRKEARKLISNFEV